MHLCTRFLGESKLPYFPIFVISFIFGILMMSIGKTVLLENTGLLDEYTLYYMKQMSVDSNALFAYVLRERIGEMVLIAILSTTYLGIVVCAGMTIWYGVALGAFFSTLFIRYGMKGLLLALTSIFPQYIFYLPIIFIFLMWCEALNRSIYFNNNFAIGRGSGLEIAKKILQLAVMISVTIIGCGFEGYVNHHLVNGFLKIF